MLKDSIINNDGNQVLPPGHSVIGTIYHTTITQHLAYHLFWLLNFLYTKTTEHMEYPVFVSTPTRPSMVRHMEVHPWCKALLPSQLQNSKNSVHFRRAYFLIVLICVHSESCTMYISMNIVRPLIHSNLIL